jgi:hypothetical protein
MSDFTADDLFETVDRLVADVLRRAGCDRPPVDALGLAQDYFDLTVTEAEPEDDRPGRFGPRPPRRRGREIVLRPDQSEEGRQAVGARGCAKELLPTVLSKLGVVAGTENRSAQGQLLSVIVPRLLLPTKWFAADARKAGYDLAELKSRYPTVDWLTLAFRLLDLDEPCVIAVVDDGAVAARRGNRSAVTKQLTAAEQKCLALVGEHREPQRARAAEWTAWGWPVPTGPWGRILLRSVPDDI